MLNAIGLKDKDITEGKSISELFSKLSEESKNQCLIYIMALRDRETLDSVNRKMA